MIVIVTYFTAAFMASQVAHIIRASDMIQSYLSGLYSPYHYYIGILQYFVN